MKKILILIYRYLNGDFAYEKYLEHQKIHPSKDILDKKTFLQNRMKERKINRCC
jgi:uncharacterized short protein YbdD (DUF466 family)